MARSPKKSNPTQEIAEALDTPIDLDWQETADTLGLSVPQLQERMSSRLGDIVFAWELIPNEHQPVIEAVKRDLETENSVRRLEVASEPAIASPEPPVIEEEPQPKKSKRQSSALTKKKKDAIEKGREATQKTQQGVKQTLARLQAQEGIKDAANAGTTYLQAFQATLNQVKGQGLTVLAAEMIHNLAADSDFNPDDILQDLGIEISADTQQALMEQLAPMLGKSQEATQEVLGTAWGNGIDLQSELLKLDSLMSYKD